MELCTQLLLPVLTLYVNLYKSLLHNEAVSMEIPGGLMQSSVFPIFKKRDQLEKQYYGPVSIPPTMSKYYKKSCLLFYTSC